MTAGGFGNHNAISVWLFKKCQSGLMFHLLQWIFTFSLSPYLYKLTRQLVGKPVFAGVVFSKGLGVAGLVVGAQLFQSLVQDNNSHSYSDVIAIGNFIIDTHKTHALGV